MHIFIVTLSSPHQMQFSCWHGDALSSKLMNFYFRAIIHTMCSRKNYFFVKMFPNHTLTLTDIHVFIENKAKSNLRTVKRLHIYINTQFSQNKSNSPFGTVMQYLLNQWTSTLEQLSHELINSHWNSCFHREQDKNQSKNNRTIKYSTNLLRIVKAVSQGNNNGNSSYNLFAPPSAQIRSCAALQNKPKT